MTKKKEKIDWRISCVAIVCLTIYGVVATMNGVNGTLRAIIFSMIALIVGIQMPQFKLNSK